MSRPFDTWRSVSLSLYMVLTGFAVLVGIPVISDAWVAQLGFSEAEAGYLAAADLGGLSLGAFACAFVIARLDRRWLVLGATLIAVAANLLCLSATDYASVLALRLLAGTASGIYTAVAIASLSAHSHPARAYSWVLFAFAFSQALELSLLPQLSMNGVYLVFAVTYALTLPFIRWLPARADQNTVAPRSARTRRSVPGHVPWLVLTAIFFTYVNIGTYWTYIKLASADSAASSAWVGHILVWSSLSSIVGCLIAGVLSKRLGVLRPLLGALLAQAAVVGMLAAGITDAKFAVSVLGFSALWMCTDIYQLTIMAGVDVSGRFAACVPGAQGLGQIIGPSIAASLLSIGVGYAGVFLLCAAASILAMALYLALAPKLAGPDAPAQTDGSRAMDPRPIEQAGS